MICCVCFCLIECRHINFFTCLRLDNLGRRIVDIVYVCLSIFDFASFDFQNAFKYWQLFTCRHRDIFIITEMETSLILNVKRPMH